jgi:flagellar basal body-associated protein FliL
LEKGKKEIKGRIKETIREVEEEIKGEEEERRMGWWYEECEEKKRKVRKKLREWRKSKGEGEIYKKGKKNTRN